MAFLIITTSMSFSNFMWLYFMEMKPNWPPTAFVTIMTKDNKQSRDRAMSHIQSKPLIDT